MKKKMKRFYYKYFKKKFPIRDGGNLHGFHYRPS